MTLNRRQFLKLTGFTALAVATPIAAALPIATFTDVPTSAFLLPFDANTPLLARTLHQVNPFAEPGESPLDALPPDMVTPILGVDEANGWLIVPEGYIPRMFAQPILASAYRPPTSITPPQYNLIDRWVQVASASAPLYPRADVNAPPFFRVGHGGIMRVIHHLSASQLNGIHWIGVADDNTLVGWTQAHLWRVFDEPTTPDNDDSRWLHIDLATHQLTAYEADQALFTAPICTNGALSSGEFEIASRTPGAHSREHLNSGMPYVVHFGDDDNDFAIGGAYWHNDFGDGYRSTYGLGVQTTIHVAAWLYGWLPSHARIRVV